MKDFDCVRRAGGVESLSVDHRRGREGVVRW